MSDAPHGRRWDADGAPATRTADAEGDAVASTGLELVASAAVNTGAVPGQLFSTASLRVNFLRPFFSRSRSRYVGTAMRVGRNAAVGDAHAVDDSGTVALTARITAYR